MIVNFVAGLVVVVVGDGAVVGGGVTVVVVVAGDVVGGGVTVVVVVADALVVDVVDEAPRVLVVTGESAAPAGPAASACAARQRPARTPTAWGRMQLIAVV